ncbi:MAG: discoidin domain-containing protein [Verrucomicrobiota bacterium]
MNSRKFHLIVSIMLTIGFVTGFSTAAQGAEARLKALLVAGGCCHDYTHQHEVLVKGIQERANVQVDVVWTDDRSTTPPLPLYNDPNWADGYDVVIHDECAAGNADLEVMHNILRTHQVIPAVHLHCAMHSFRNGTDLWFKHLGLQSSSHGPQVPIDIHFTDTAHPITATLKDWTTIREELYNNVKLFDAHPLASGKQVIRRDGNERVAEAVVAWINEKQGARSFSTTIGHNTETVADPRYLELITRGLLWACDQLNTEHLTPYSGKNKVTFVEAKPKPQAATAPQPGGNAPKDATLVQVTASSTQDQRWTWMAIDGNKETRWCASGAETPQWLQLEFENPQEISGVDIVWESQTNAYGYKLESSMDGKTWTSLFDATNNVKRGKTQATFPAKTMRFLKLTGTRTIGGGWISLWELSVKGKDIKSLFPKLDSNEQKTAVAARQTAEDPLAKGGNITPKIAALNSAEVESIMKDVKVPEGFDVTLFASSATANYPVYVAASPDGDLYVSSDGNGSLGRNPHRGRVLRLRDSNNDGKADEVKEFIKDIDSPRGLIWDQDRLYLLHPPHISVFYDRDGDGISEDSKRLVSGIAFDFDQRPPDHTTNGLELGIDGWIYIAGGDFGFMNAEGTDGRKLQHRGGGVIRFRPDGTGLQLFATGTRNILGTPMSPLLDMFARDNTNDGGGWDVRLHHFTGLEDHGYPRLYKNFGEEHIQPLADYGGGSGCGSVYIHEPGFPAEWANAPFTCDWGRAATFHHSVERRGATFVETSAPKPFIQVTRPTDADVDGMSRVYQASWKGPATFNWAGPDHGYIVRVTPKGYNPEPLPVFDHLTDAALIKLLESPSHIRTLAAQRTLLRRDPTPDTTGALLQLAANRSKDLGARIAALYAVTQRGIDSRLSAEVIEQVKPLIQDTTLQAFVLRALGDMGLNLRTQGVSGPVEAAVFETGMDSDDPRTRLEAIIAATHQGRLNTAGLIAASLGHEDGVIAHTAFRSLAELGASEACFAVLDSASSSNAQKQGASFALMRMHESDVVEGLISRLQDPGKISIKPHLLSALCRLYHQEAEWKGDSWGTRPDTRGPYYQLDTWGQSERILEALKQELASAGPEQAALLISEMNRNRIQSNEALERIIDLATEDASHVGAAVSQLAAIDDIPAKAVPLLIKAANNPLASPAVLSQSIAGLAKTRHSSALNAMLTAMSTLQNAEGSDKEQAAGRSAFLGSALLVDQHEQLEKLAAEDLKSPAAKWANAGLLALAERKNIGPEITTHVRKAIDLGWQEADRRVLLMNTAALLRNHYLDARIQASMNDFDPDIADAAKSAARRLRIPAPGEDNTSKIGDLTPEKALEQVASFKGDIALGEAVFLRAACATCHTVSQDQKQKGPYLGNIANTYRRNDLALSILDPNKTIAQGFATNFLHLKDGRELTGFVVNEAGDQVVLRDILAQEHNIEKRDIQERRTLETSIMPEGLMAGFSVKEMASLLDYLENLSSDDE